MHPGRRYASHTRDIATGRRVKQLPRILLAGCALLALMGTAHAQTTPAAPTAEPENGDIIVTAQKRPEDVKDVPLSISVIGGAAIEKQKIQNYEDLARVVPSLSVTNTGGSNLSRITLRGVASNQGTATVGVYLDDVSLTIPNLFFTGATLPELFDLDHVEVLRGPQGTLYGASSLGGTIRFISNAPKLDVVEGDVRADVSGTHKGAANYLLQGVVNLPLITDRAALRIGVQRRDDSGYVDRIDGSGTVHKGVNNERVTTVRSSLLFQASDTLSITPGLLWQESKSNGTALFDRSSLPDYQQNKLSREYNNDRLIVPSLTIHADLGGADLTSVTSYLDRVNKRNIDAQIYDSEYIAEVLDPDYGTTYDTIAGLTGLFHNNVYAHQWTQELRLASKSIKETGHPYEWQVGAYYSNQKIRSTDDEYVLGLGDAITDIFGEDPSTVLEAPLVNDVLGYFHTQDDRREYAVFAEGSLQLTAKLKATVGLRQSFARSYYSIDEGGWLAYGLPATKDRRINSKPFTPKFALSYEASANATIYATAAKGFRLGGSSAPLPSSCAASIADNGLTGDGETYSPDSLWSYEGGAKLRLLNNRLRVNASGYYIDWKNIQQSLSLSSCGYVTVVNAGNARSYGGELEIQAQITRALSFGLSGSLVDAKVTEAAEGTGASDGQWLLGVPKNNVTGSIDYRQPFAGNLAGYVHLDINRVGESHGSFSVTNSDYDRPAYTIANVTVGMEAGAFDLSVFARNLFDEDRVIQSPSVVFIRQGLTIRRRTIGVSGRFKF